MYKVRYQRTKHGMIIRAANNLTENEKTLYIKSLPNNGFITILKKRGNRWYKEKLNVNQTTLA